MAAKLVYSPRMLDRVAWIVVAAAVAACSGGSAGKGGGAPVGPPDRAVEAPPGDPPRAGIRTLEADETVTLPSGATFTASAGWTVEVRSDLVVLTGPEGDLTAAYVEVEAVDRAAAITAAWSRWKPDFELSPAAEQDFPPREGWDAIGQVVYVTPSAEQRLVVAVGRRKGETWYVLMADGKQAAFSRRGAQLGTAVESLEAPGVEKESFVGKTAHPLDAARLAELEKFIEEGRVAAKVPGCAIAIVQGGKIVFEKGFGVRQLGKPAKVTPRTLFMIGSVGKSLTTLMIARLVEAKKFGWDTPVIEVLPQFGLGDELTTREVKMRHTACACTGMPRQDFEMLFEGAVTPEERLASLKTMKPTTRFGETFQYSNLMVSAGGFAAGHSHAPGKKLGPAYDDAMQKLVFEPLGMKSTTFDFRKVAKADHAVPHPRDLRGEPRPMPIGAERWVLPVRPAGGTWSSVHDMARVLLLELGSGTLDGVRIIGEEYLLERRNPQIKISDDASYALGLTVGKTHGQLPAVNHGGGTGGFNTWFMFLPEHAVGMVIVSNASGAGQFNGAVERRLLEILFDGRPEAKEDLTSAIALAEKQRADDWKLIEEKPEAAWFEQYAGAWSAPGLGRIKLRNGKKTAILDAGEWKVPVGKMTDRDGTVKLITTGGMLPGIELIPREQDGRTVLVLDAAQQAYVFERTRP
jgi:CubicO group peptidase (beta-lactamase class C family)